MVGAHLIARRIAIDSLAIDIFLSTSASFLGDTFSLLVAILRETSDLVFCTLLSGECY